MFFHKKWSDPSCGGAVMSDNDLLDPILPSLADDFEAHRPNSAGREIKPKPEEWEALRVLFARQFTDGFMLHSGQGKASWTVKLTQQGYTEHLPRIEALRAFGGARTA
jgi:hypothetical protein